MDAGQDATDVQSFEALRPLADGFRNYYHDAHFMAPEEALVDKAQLMRLSGPEMTVLVGGLRVLGANAVNNVEGRGCSRTIRASSRTTSSSTS